MEDNELRVRRRSSRSRTREIEAAPEGVLVRCADAGFALTIFLLPFVMGGRQAWGHLLLGLLACWTALSWSIHQLLADRPKWRWSGAEPLFVMGLALLLLQVVTLPAETVQAISPAIGKRLPLWTPDTTFGPWTTLSLTPQDTLASLLTVASCMLLFLTAVQRFQRVEEISEIVGWVGMSAAAMSVFGIVQLLFGNGKFFWFYEHPYTDTLRVAKGGFTNANHFAHFIALGVPIWLWKLAMGGSGGSRRSRDEWNSGGPSSEVENLKKIVAGCCLGVIAMGLLLSQSRGGIAVGALGAGVTLFFLWRQSLIGAGLMLTVVGLAGLSAVSLAVFGDQVESMVQSSLSELATTDLNTLDKGAARQKIWSSALAAARDYPVVGTGLSSHIEVYPTYFDASNEGIEYTHAENGYLQVLMETGVTGLAIAMLFVVVVAYWCFRGIARSTSAEIGAPLAAISAALVMNLAHSVTDFLWYVPALMSVALILAAAAVRLYQLSGPSAPAVEAGPHLFSRGAWGLLACSVMMLAAVTIRVEWPIVAAEPHWFNYIHLSRAISAVESESDDTLPDLGLARRRLASIATAVRANPSSHRAQLALARSYVQYVELKLAESENAMPLAQIRDAARSNFESVEEMREWLENPSLLGDRRKMLSAAANCTRRALSLCPLAGRGYLTLSDLVWLDGLTDDDEQLLVDQAEIVRPYDPRVHFVMGRRDFVAQRYESAMDHWREAFNRDRTYRRQLIQGLADLLPPRFFLENFDMELESLQVLWAAYQKSEDTEGRRDVLVALADAEIDAAKNASGNEAVRHYLAACNCFMYLNEREEMVRVAEAAVKSNRNNVDARYRLGMVLYENGDYAGAADHLTWCVHHQPDNADLQVRAERAIMMQGKARTRIASDGDSGTTR